MGVSEKFAKDQVIWLTTPIMGCQKVKYKYDVGLGFSKVLTLTGKPRMVRVENSNLSAEAWVSPLVTFSGSWS